MNRIIICLIRYFKGDEAVRNYLLNRARKRCQKRLRQVRNKKRKSKYTPTPRYDEVYYEGMKWLNSLQYEDSFDKERD